ncbi:PREDICTED: dnaJ homolog subfamily B member 6-like [Priapulus caudatus]|uniref:DnaJ homolog subfamily B member 6-like n=1 Tax=Priapulus caudatus TaxID=37621 RepID=A0ABM1ESY7_PRICU|nr:PREDICTED: dnaJ homolog subfamily B member 6-like [Priapulus caudatus]
MTIPDCYEVLGLRRDATDEEIKRAYRQMALRWHPDKNRGGASEAVAEARFKQISEAYEMLSDPTSRRRHDAARFGGRGRHRAPTRGADFPSFFRAGGDPFCGFCFDDDEWIVGGRRFKGERAPAGGANAKRTSTSTRFIDGKTVVTRTIVANGVATVTVHVDGELKSTTATAA